MGRISFLSKIPPPPILVAHAHHHRQYHYNASNASPFSFLLLIATVAAGEVLAIFVCKIIADYADMGMHSQDQAAKIRLSGAKRRSLIDRALVVSQCHRSKRRQHSPTDASTCAAGDDNDEMHTDASTCAAGDDNDEMHASDDANSCPICLRDFRIEKSDICRPVSCSHVYHRSCITGWLEQHETCPLCRSDIFSSPDVAPSPMAPSRRRLLWTQSTMWGEDM